MRRRAINASTSRVELFLQAWRAVQHMEDGKVRLAATLEIYETSVINEDWDGEIPDALEGEFGMPLDFGGTDSNY